VRRVAALDQNDLTRRIEQLDHGVDGEERRSGARHRSGVSRVS
jgi:hypothetical protein